MTTTKLHPGSQRWFPKVFFKMIRSNNPPNTQVFRVSAAMNKIDIKEYLKKLYDVNPITVRTAVYNARQPNFRKAVLQRLLPGFERSSRIRARQFKRVTVTFDRDFYFPPPQEFAQFENNYQIQDGPTQAQFKTERARILHSYKYSKLCMDAKKVYDESIKHQS